MPQIMGGDGAAPSPGWLLRASMASCAATFIAMRAAQQGIELRSLEISVDSESDSRGLVGIPGSSTALSGMRIAIRIGADDVAESRLRELAEFGEANSPVGCTLRERPPLAVEVSVV
jgi:uncharacterized OsmC-like protein